MNDKTITKIIPKIHLRIGLFLFFVFLTVFFTFIALLEGISIDRLKVGEIKIEKLYLKWDKALLIEASKVDLSNLVTDETPLTLKPLSKLPSYIRFAEGWIEHININIIKYKDVDASLLYQKNSPGKITIRYGNTTYKTTFSLDPKRFYVSLPHLKLFEADISGTLVVKLKEQVLAADILLLLPETPAIRIKATGNSDTLALSLHPAHELLTLKPLIRFIGIDPEIVPWIVDYAQAEALLIHRLEGTFHYDKPEELLMSLRADATVSMGEYTFAQGIDPIKAPSVDLKFTNGKLYIYPKSGTFYNLPTEKSYLFIDFTTPHAQLNAFIRTRHAKLNDPILNLLRYYKIDLPIKQTAGECDVDLNLSVNLHSLDTTAQGVFRPTASELLLEQIPLRSEGGIVTLDNTRVIFDNFVAHYGENIAHAKVKGNYDAHNEHGIVSIDAYDVSLTENNHRITLFDARNPLRVNYSIAPGRDMLNVMPSQWNLLGETLKIDEFHAPFDYHRAYVSVQSVPFAISDKIKGNFSAIFNGAEKKTDVRLHLKEFNFGEISLRHAPLDINIHYDKILSILQSPSASAWSFHKLPLHLSPFNASLKDQEIIFERIDTVLGDILKGTFAGKYRIDTNKGAIRLSNMIPIYPKIAPLIDTKEFIDLSVDASGDEINLNAETLKAHFSTIPKGWKISITDIALLARKSPLLRSYDIESGYLNLFYTGESSRYTFSGEINYPYSLMVINDQPISRYRFSGAYQDDRSTIRINDRLMMTQSTDGISIRAYNSGINMQELSKFLSRDRGNKHSDANQSSASLPIRIDATNTYLYLSKDRKIVADSLNATLQDDDLDASLHHSRGNATLKMRDGVFYIDGRDFNDKFMKHLFSFGDFIGGEFSFQAKGNSDTFEGIMKVENTILKEYKVLNNVLAFINTVPSLATFSLPDYNTQGLPVKEGYLHFAYDKGMVNIDNFTINSREIKILGEGHADLKDQTLLATLTLKSDLGSKFSKIPMVGYIIFGDDGSISTTVSVSGKIENPTVETAIAKEIVTAPFNILKRTLIYPFLWMIEDKKKK